VKAAKQKRLERTGWRIGSAEDFLGLTPEEAALVHMRVSLARSLRVRRTQLGLTQTQLAQRLGSSQSRVAKMEAGAASVSLDLFVRAMLATGAKPADVGQAFAVA
jgi:DNA-binding XRE family transcriptional regulator